MTKKLVFFGAGGVAAELTSQIEDSNWGRSEGYEIKGYTGSSPSIYDDWKEYGYPHPFLGYIADYKIEKEDNFVLAFSDIQARQVIAKYIKQHGGRIISLVHPTASLAANLELGEGNIIYPSVIVGPNTKIGNFNLMTTQTIISHDSIIGDNNFFSTTLLCGHVRIGNENFFGVRSTVMPWINVGNNNTIQANMLVDKNIEDGTTVFYKFKERIMIIKK